jgi:lysosomal alpha-mannosidase
MRHLICLFVLLLTASGWSSARVVDSTPNSCGYDACRKLDPNMINIHLVPHSHCDVGWLKTVDQYFYGLRTDIQRAGVQYTLDTVVRALAENPERRFIVVETSLFWMWARRLDKAALAQVEKLVLNGQLEFISGGWSMNDEADVHYNPVIDQMTRGHRMLTDTFGKCAVPKIGWQIDPFGHSQEQAALFAQMGFDGLFFGRLDHDDKGVREKEKRMEFLWKASPDLGSAGSLFTGVLPNGYSPPGGFDFDDLSGDDGIVDDPESEEYNVDKKVSEFFQRMDDQAKHYATNNLIITAGTDFQYQNAFKNFKNWDMMIKYVNKKQENGSKYNLFYSTPTCYLKSLNEANKTWTTKTDDFFPYSSDQHAYWTGYFTSRPAIKLHERKSNAFLQMCKHFQTFAGFNDKSSQESATDVLKRALGIAQHHDAVSGTEKQHVANDYALQMNKGILKCQQVIDDAFNKLVPKSDSDPAGVRAKLSFCPKLNVSECQILEQDSKIAVILYNPRSQEVMERVSIPWTNKAFSLKTSAGEEVRSELIEIPEFIRKLSERAANTTHEISFYPKIPALGFATFFLEKKDKDDSNVRPVVTKAYKSRAEQEILLKGRSFSASFHPNTGNLISVTASDGTVFAVKQQYLYYKGHDGDNSKPENRASGAYIFRPDGQEAIPIGKQVKAEFVRGKTVSEVRQKISESVSQVIRVSPNSDTIEFDWVIGPIPVEDKIGKEYITRFNIDGFKTDNTFYTDANGRQIVKRMKDHRDTWKLNVTEPVAGNYYPVNSRIFVRDVNKGYQMTVLTDRTQGGTSMSDGTIELMVHRRLLHDDAFGVSEALSEPGVDGKGLVIRGVHKLLISKINEAHVHRDLGISMYLEPQVFFTTYSDVADYVSKYQTQWSGLKNPLPANVHLMTLEEWKDDTILIRLEHFYDSNDDPDKMSKPVTVSLNNLLRPYTIVSAEEMTLSANQKLSESKRLDWKTDKSDRVSSLIPSLKQVGDEMTIELKPLEIRTLIVKVKASESK